MGQPEEFTSAGAVRPLAHKDIMDQDNLKQAVRQLHEVLAANAPLDPELRSLLTLLDADIRTHLEPSLPAAPVDDSLSGRTQALSARFAAAHPHLEPVLRELQNTLQRIGI
jgi:alpha-D-ribose 1-methylphosphonate 5-triphosphate synthase subunit PhnH